MAMKAIVQSLDGIPEPLRQDYKPIEGGTGFFFDLEGVTEHPNVLALKRAKDREAMEATTAKSALKNALDELQKLKGEHESLSSEFEARLKGAVGNSKEDLERLEKKYAEKMQKGFGERDTVIEQHKTALHKLLVMDAARAIVAKMGPADPEYTDVILPHVVSRLTVEINGNEARTRVLDPDGKISADSVDELTEHFRVDKRFAPLLTGSKARGGSANEAGHASSAPGKIDLTKATAEEKAAYYKAKQGIK